MCIRDSGGLESLAWIDAHTTPPANWLAQQQAVLTDAQKPGALVNFVFLHDLERLVNFAAGAPTTTAPATPPSK